MMIIITQVEIAAEEAKGVLYSLVACEQTLTIITPLWNHHWAVYTGSNQVKHHAVWSVRSFRLQTSTISKCTCVEWALWCEDLLWQSRLSGLRKEYAQQLVDCPTVGESPVVQGVLWRESLSKKEWDRKALHHTIIGA